jgi:nucleotide-binding universal stress UspA family protein
MYKHILIPLDGSKLAETAIAHTEELAKGCGTEDIILLRVVERTKGYRKVVDPSRQPEQQMVPEPVRRKEREARSHITKMAKKLTESGPLVQ